MPEQLYNDLRVRLETMRRASEDAAKFAYANNDGDREQFWTREHDQSRRMLGRLNEWWESGGKGQQ